MRNAERGRWDSAPSPRLTPHPVRSLVAAAAAVLLLSACQDPAGVGLGLIDEEQLDPNVRTVPLTDFTTAEDTTIAIGQAATGTGILSQTRVLVGQVTDPVFGDARAVAYLDFRQSSSLDGDAEASAVTEAWIELDRAYAYGDTTTALPVELRTIDGDWEVDTGYPRDTLFSTGSALSTTEIVAADTLRRFDLPAGWVSDNAETLISSSFADDFEGFALQVPDGYAPTPGVVYGFNTFQSEGSGLRVVVADDTLLYPLAEVFSSVATEAAAMPPTGALAVRTGGGGAIRFDADFSPIGSAPLARAALRLPVDASLAREGAFVRPIASSSLLYGIQTVDGEETLIGLGLVVFDGDDLLLMSDTIDLTAAVQALLLDDDDGFDGYELRPLRSTASLSIYPIVLPASGADAEPRYTLTVVGSAPE